MSMATPLRKRLIAIARVFLPQPLSRSNDKRGFLQCPSVMIVFNGHGALLQLNEAG